MPASSPLVVQGAVEGDVDEAVLRRITGHAGLAVGRVYGKGGKTHLLQRLAGYNEAARISPWVVLIDLDQDAECAARVRGHWLPDPAPGMCLRIVVRAVEAWLLADRQRIARFLSVAESRIPHDSETVLDPKRQLVDLARGSRSRAIQRDMVPRSGAGRVVGPAYSSRLVEFVENDWDPTAAATGSDSLRRCLDRLEDLRMSLEL